MVSKVSCPSEGYVIQSYKHDLRVLADRNLALISLDTTMNEYVETFMVWLGDISPHTEKTYRSDLRQFEK
jgi:hypothetical protein